MTTPLERIDEALLFVIAVGMPPGQCNERSALTMLGILGLTPDLPWSAASQPMRGITQLMSFFSVHYGQQYQPNTRETVRRFTMHQFVEAGIAISNPDNPTRPTNSPKWCYQVTEPTVRLARAFKSAAWDAELLRFRAELGSLRERNAAHRDRGQQ